MGQSVADYFPEVEKYVRIATRTDIVRYGDVNFSERFHLVDKAFFEVFFFQMTTENQIECLNSQADLLRFR